MVTSWKMDWRSVTEITYLSSCCAILGKSWEPKLSQQLLEKKRGGGVGVCGGDCRLDCACCWWNINNCRCFSSVQLLSRVQLFATPWTTACQASLSITNSWSLPKLMSLESVMPSNRLILCCPLLLLPSIFPSIRVFSNESALHIKWPKYHSFSFNISPSNEYPELISFRMD